MKKAWLILIAITFVLLWPEPAAAAKIRFTFDAWDGPAMHVWLTRPVGLAPDRPVVFVMHGVKRNADDYRDQWHDLALKHDFLLVVPEFNQRDFPGSEEYNLGKLHTADGQATPRGKWSYSAIEPIFDHVKTRFGMTTTRYALYGHSAGSQFVHRYIFHVPDARVSRIVSANAGWYMMPDYQTGFPYGLGGSLVTSEMLGAALQLPVTILLGDRDTDPEHPNLRRAPEAMMQGTNRLQRGQTFFATARLTAERLGVPFNWSMVLVPGADHDNRLMAPAAIPYLVDESEGVAQ